MSLACVDAYKRYRVLVKCGGLVFDIADAIVWASVGCSPSIRVFAEYDARYA